MGVIAGSCCPLLPHKTEPKCSADKTRFTATYIKKTHHGNNQKVTVHSDSKRVHPGPSVLALRFIKCRPLLQCSPRGIWQTKLGLTDDFTSPPPLLQPFRRSKHSAISPFTKTPLTVCRSLQRVVNIARDSARQHPTPSTGLGLDCRNKRVTAVPVGPRAVLSSSQPPQRRCHRETFPTFLNTVQQGKPK